MPLELRAPQQCEVEDGRVRGKLLIVEDEPIVALDLQQELEQLGCEIVGVAESADEALAAAEMTRPDLALMDVRIVGSMDGIQAARLLRSAYQVPVVFLTSYSDEDTVKRASREMPYGYLTKPFQSRQLKATLSVALVKARADAKDYAAHQEMAASVEGMRDGLLTISLDGVIQFMNKAAENLTGWELERARGRQCAEVLRLRDGHQRPMPVVMPRDDGSTVEEFGWTLTGPSGIALLVDLSVAPLTDNAGERSGNVLTLRDAAQRLRTQAIEETIDQAHSFDTAPMGMVQLDAEGRIVRVNNALLQESGVAAESLLGRSLTALGMDPDPRIAKQLMHKLLSGAATVATSGPPVMN
jgi:PAS domain S-box-containing protein